MKMAILELLKQEGFIKAVNVLEVDGHKKIEIALEYKNKTTPRISGVSRVSKPSRRVYKGVTEIQQVKFGHGVSVLSTPKGILTNNQARNEMVGGEVLFTIW
jgi:small subunit ribosomal protein S8